MPDYNFSELYAQFPAVVDEMPDTFTSHEFILRLAQEHQKLYIEALYAYRVSRHRGEQTPFMIVHGILAKHLATLPDLENLGEVPSIDIFSQSSACAKWKKR